MNNVLITGVAGMLGSHLLDELIQSPFYNQIYGLDDLSVGNKSNIENHINNHKFTFFQGNILDKKKLDKIPSVKTIVHLAAAKKIDEEKPGVDNLLTNGLGSENIFKLAEKYNAKLIFGSTSDCYGMSKDLPFKENGDLLLGPSMIKRWSYAVGKLFAEQLAFAYYKDFGVPVVILRYFGGFSERASFTWSSGHIPLFIDAILKDEPCIIHGDGSQTRSMTHVSNLVNGTLAAMTKEQAIGELINIGDDYELSVLDCAKLIHKLAHTNKPLKVEYMPFKQIFGSYKDITRRIPDLSKAKELLNYKIGITFEESIKRVIHMRKKILNIC